MSNSKSTITMEISRKLPPNEIVRGVGQGEAATTHADSTLPILGSSGALPCMILAMYNSRTKRAVLAHIDALSLPFQVVDLLKNEIIQDVHDHTDFVEIDVYLASGYTAKEESLAVFESVICEHREKIRTALTDDERLVIRSEIISSSFAIDTRDGSIYFPVSKGQLDYGPDIYQRQADRFGRKPGTVNDMSINFRG